MTDDAAAFAAWVVALVPRLLLWPGGVALLLAGGWAWWRQRKIDAAPASALVRLGLALAWVVVALLPLPGAAPLVPPPDALVLTGLLLAAGALAGDGARSDGAALCTGAVAVCAAGAGGFLLPFAAVAPPVALLAALAYAGGLASMADSSPAAPPLPRLLLTLGWAGLAALLPAPWNLLAGAGVLAALLALAGWSLPARFARQTAGVGWLALVGAVIALLLG